MAKSSDSVPSASHDNKFCDVENLPFYLIIKVLWNQTLFAHSISHYQKVVMPLLVFVPLFMLIRQFHITLAVREITAAGAIINLIPVPVGNLSWFYTKNQ